MPESAKTLKGKGNSLPMSSVVTLAFWRWRQTWFLMSITTIGIVAAVLILCAVPLFSEVMNTAGLRNVLRSAPDSAEIQVNVGTLGISTAIVNNVRDQFRDLVKQNLGSPSQPSQFAMVTTDFAFVPSPVPSKDQRSLILYSAAMQQAASHVTRVQGRAPGLTSNPANEIEVMLTPDTAKGLHVKVGDTIKLQYTFYTKQPDIRSEETPPQKIVPVAAHVSGIFNIDPANSAYWHGNDFKVVQFTTQQRVTQYTYTMLVDNDSLLAYFDRIRAQYHVDTPFSATFNYNLIWYYRLDPSRITTGDLDTLINQLAALQDAYSTAYGDVAQGEFAGPPSFPYINNTNLASPLFSTDNSPSNLERFRSRSDVARIPVAVLTLQIILLILFFVSLITNLLVDRQADTIAVLRSRGASSGQIFGALLTQCVFLALLALVIGLPLAVFTVIKVAQRFLPPANQDALNVITNNPQQAVQSVIWYAVAIVLVALLTMSISLFFAARADVLAVRREAARTKKRPLWQRLNLDVIAGIVALVGYALSVYVTSIGDLLQGDAKTLIATPLSIIAPFFIIIGFMFLFLRIFPLFLRLAAWLATRGRGAVSMLALAQIARSPRLSIRMTMLLALSTAFALFTLVYTGTQAQHIQDFATYQVGADFSGTLSSLSNLHDTTAVTARYQDISGVITASAGFTAKGTSIPAALPMEVRAVDSSTFARATIWPTQETYKAASSLLTQLAARRKSAISADLVPAIADATTMNRLRLHIGSPFVVKVDGMDIPDMHCLVIGTVPHVPTVNDRTALGPGKGFSIVGSVMVDFQTYVGVYAKDVKRSRTLFGAFGGPSINHIWLHTKDDAASLSNVRTDLKKSGFRLDNLADRRALLASLTTDPLYLVLTGVLSVGTVTALLLALMGDLLTSWLSARTRLTGFAILRAIGTTPRQVASMLTWEQAIVYITGILIGVGFGALLSYTVIPALTFTSSSTDLSTDQFYALQTVLPTQVVLPPTLPLGLIALVAIYAIALTMMIRVVTKPSLSQTLRLNED